MIKQHQSSWYKDFVLHETDVSELYRYIGRNFKKEMNDGIEIYKFVELNLITASAYMLGPLDIIGGCNRYEEDIVITDPTRLFVFWDLCMDFEAAK